MSEVSDETGLRERLIKHLDAGERLQAHLLVVGEARRVKSAFTDELFPVIGTVDYAAIRTRLRKYAELSHPLLELVAVGCFVENRGMETTWSDVIEFVSEYPRPYQQCVTNLRRLRSYPALMLAYCGGVASIAGGTYGVLQTLLYKARIINARNYEEKALAQNLLPDEVLDSQHAAGIFSEEADPHDVNNHLLRVIRPVLLDLVPSDRKYDEAFDRFEAFLALAYAELKYPLKDGVVTWVPAGRFQRRRDDQASVWERLKAEADAEGEHWAPLQAGLFHGSLEYFYDLKSRVDQSPARAGIW